MSKTHVALFCFLSFGGKQRDGASECIICQTLKIEQKLLKRDFGWLCSHINSLVRLWEQRHWGWLILYSDSILHATTLLIKLDRGIRASWQEDQMFNENVWTLLGWATYKGSHTELPIICCIVSPQTRVSQFQKRRPRRRFLQTLKPYFCEFLYRLGFLRPATIGTRSTFLTTTWFPSLSNVWHLDGKQLKGPPVFLKAFCPKCSKMTLEMKGRMDFTPNMSLVKSQLQEI